MEATQTGHAGALDGQQQKQKGNVQTIFRTQKQNHYTILPNSLLRNRSLSFKARGVLAMVLSNKDDWEVHSEWIQERGTEGEHAVRTAMAELEAAGYARFTVERDENGRFSRRVWTFHEQPILEENRSNHLNPVKTAKTSKTSENPNDSPQRGFPVLEYPSRGKPSPKNTITKKTIPKKTIDRKESGEVAAATAQSEKRSATEAACVPKATPGPDIRYHQKPPGVREVLTHALVYAGFDTVSATRGFVDSLDVTRPASEVLNLIPEHVRDDAHKAMLFIRTNNRKGWSGRDGLRMAAPMVALERWMDSVPDYNVGDLGKEWVAACGS